MISRKEIAIITKSSGVPADTIDKDYVLGHFLFTLFSFDWSQEHFLFKGGTCLRKCYFENYRFSEDIDITILNEDFVFTQKHIIEVCALMQERTEIETNILKFEKVYHKDNFLGWDVEICYWGANHLPSETPIFRKDCHTKIWVELRFFEKILFPSVQKTLIHLFSDIDLVSVQIPCYSLHEVLAEKMRALIQRNRGEARDYFDLWYIKTHVEDIDWVAVKSAFYEKCKFKAIEFKGVDDFFRPERMKQVEITWERRLNHQLPQKVDRVLVMSELKTFFYQIFP